MPQILHVISKVNVILCDIKKVGFNGFLRMDWQLHHEK